MNSNGVEALLLTAVLNVGLDIYFQAHTTAIPSVCSKTSTSLLSAMVFTTGSFNGETVQQALDAVDNSCGGCGGSASASESDSDFSLNFDGGIIHNGDLACATKTTPSAPTVVTKKTNVCKTNF